MDYSLIDELASSKVTIVNYDPDDHEADLYVSFKTNKQPEIDKLNTSTQKMMIESKQTNNEHFKSLKSQPPSRYIYKQPHLASTSTYSECSSTSTVTNNDTKQSFSINSDDEEQFRIINNGRVGFKKNNLNAIKTSQS